MEKMEQETLEALASALAKKAQRQLGSTTATTPPSEAPRHHRNKHIDTATRSAAIRRIRLLASSYNLEWLFEQETFGVTSIGELDDQQITELLIDMERARQCISEGESFEDAGLVRDTSIHLATRRKHYHDR